MKIELIIDENAQIDPRFVNGTANIRLRKVDGGFVLEQQRYATTDENGNHIAMVEGKWFQIKLV